MAAIDFVQRCLKNTEVRWDTRTSVPLVETLTETLVLGVKGYSKEIKNACVDTIALLLARCRSDDAMELADIEARIAVGCGPDGKTPVTAEAKKLARQRNAMKGGKGTGPYQNLLKAVMKLEKKNKSLMQPVLDKAEEHERALG